MTRLIERQLFAVVPIDPWATQLGLKTFRMFVITAYTYLSMTYAIVYVCVIHHVFLVLIFFNN